MKQKIGELAVYFIIIMYMFCVDDGRKINAFTSLHFG